MAARLRVVVVALGGNAVSPSTGDLSMGGERAAVERAATELGALAADGPRLLVVHGNGPQVGRLLATQGAGAEALDVHVAQSQGELGYLLAQAIDRRLDGPRTVALVTRVLVDEHDPAFRHPVKPIGPMMAAPETVGRWAPTADGRGWRRVVASPRPRAVVELPAIRTLLAAHHVVAGGGGGVAIGEGAPGAPVSAVIDKDWVAGLLATTLGAERLVFVTDVAEVLDDFARATARPIRAMRAAQARARLAAGVFAAGSMAPKVESAVGYVEATGRPAVIAGLGGVAAALDGTGGTTIYP